jgi:hypothetical protein
MQRRLLRTITVTLTITEHWSVVYRETHSPEPLLVRMATRTLRRESVAVTATDAGGAQVLPSAGPGEDSAG